VEEASMAVERAEELAARAEAKLKALDVKMSSSSSSDDDDDDDENEEKSSSRVQELKKSLEEMKQANLELRKKKGKAASSSSSSSSSKSSSSTPVSRLAAIEREEKEEEEKKKGVANNADVDNTNNFGGGSQRRLYDQMLTLRTRLNERVASSNAFAKYLEKTLLTRDDDLKRANELLYGAAKESGELLRLIRDAQNDIAKSGDDPTRRARGEQKLEQFVNRLQLVESTLTKNAKEIDSTVVRTVPVEYHGIASDVIMMGDFDGWTRGIQLYPSFVEGGSSTFTGEARLPPGTYLVKFKVDGEWRLAREWPSSGEGFDANNVLTVMQGKIVFVCTYPNIKSMARRAFYLNIAIAIRRVKKLVFSNPFLIAISSIASMLFSSFLTSSSPSFVLMLLLLLLFILLSSFPYKSLSRSSRWKYLSA
jgi:hypothetical protein